MGGTPVPPGPLSGARLLVTRPAAQADALCRLVAQAGGEAIAFPAIEILPLPAAEDIRAADYDILIFVSRNAVLHGASLLRGTAGRRLGAVGPSTARALEALGHAVTLRPAAGFDTEALLREPALQQLDGCRVLIVRGRGGRELLGETLASRGAELRYAEVYERRPTRADPGPLIERWRREGIDVVTATSVEILEHLAAVLGPRGADLLRGALLVTASARVVKRAAAMGIERPPVLAAGPDDQALVEAVAAGRARWACGR